MSAETPKKSGRPQIVKLDKAFKLAEQWVNNMSKVVEEETIDVAEPKGHHDRVGLGATAVPVRQSKVGNFNNPVERRLHAKLEAGKRRAAKSIEEEREVRRGSSDNDGDDDSDEEFESRTNVFSKKRSAPAPNSSLEVKKKHK